MTRPDKTAEEQSQVAALLQGLVAYDLIDMPPPPAPDALVRRSGSPVLAVEVTQYHPTAEGGGEVPRMSVEASWRALASVLDRRGRERASLRNVLVWVRFKDATLPARSRHERLAGELVTLAATLAEQLTSNGQTLLFTDRPPALPCLTSMRVQRQDGLYYPPWQCEGLNSAWVDPSAEEFQRIFEKKAEKARGYTTGGLPLWLLVVCDVEGDPQSFAYPSDDHDVRKLEEAVTGSGFDLSQGPFAAVWLLSARTGCRHSLYRRGDGIG